MSQTPALTPLSLSHVCAAYLKAQFKYILNARSSGASATRPEYPLMLRLDLVSELDAIADTLLGAFLNRKVVDWDVTRYAENVPRKVLKPDSKESKKKEESLRKQYPPLDRVTISAPCIIVDRDGVILAWYLPDVLSDSRQNAMLEAREKLRPLMKTSTSTASSGPWRNDPKYFQPGEGPEGSVNLSPAWFQQAHDGRSQLYPQVSANFRTHADAALGWLDSISESNAVLSAILAVIHPKLYDAGRQTANCLRDTPEINPQVVLRRWASVFSGVSVISNRTTPPHRDTGSRFTWYDILATLGHYQNCTLDLPGVGISLEYGPGAVVGILGKVLMHEVPKFEGDRVCYAYFMRDNVHAWAKVPCSNWMSIRLEHCLYDGTEFVAEILGKLLKHEAVGSEGGEGYTCSVRDA